MVAHNVAGYLYIMNIKRNTTQTIVNIIDLLSRCELDDLKAIKTALDDLIRDAKNLHNTLSAKDLQERRSSLRYQTKLMSTLVRITDVKSGEKKEFNAEILDISRHGLRLRVDATFVFSRIVKATFACPGQMTKQCYLEIAHMKKVSDSAGVWIDIGCHGVISEKEVRLVRGREIRIEKMKSKIQSKKDIKILVIGQDSSKRGKLINCLRAEGFQLRRTANSNQALKILKDPTFDLALFFQDNASAMNPDLLEAINCDMNDLAKLALLANPEDEKTFLEQGFDHALFCNGSREEIVAAVEETLMNHVISRNENGGSLIENVTALS